MNSLPFDAFESTAKILNLDLDVVELSHLAEERGFSSDQMKAVDEVFEYLREKKMISLWQFWKNTSVRFVGTVLCPNFVRKYFFKKLMRKSKADNK